MHVIITGGSSGIGLEVARLMKSAGHDVSLIARGGAQLDQAKHSLDGIALGRVFTASADVGNQDALRNAILSCEGVLGPCDRLVTSAGIVEPSLFDDADPEIFRLQMETNFFGTVHAVRAVYSRMKERRRGSIMMISSAASLIGIPGYTAYCASKAALRLFAESLRAEAEQYGIKVLISFPPDTRTPQFEKEILVRPVLAQALVGRSEPWTAVEVANRIVDGMSRRGGEIHFGLKLRALSIFGPFIKPVLYWLLRQQGRASQKQVHP